VALLREAPVKARNPTRLMGRSGFMRLAGHGAMGVAMALAFALLLTLIDPSGIATLVVHGGHQAIAVFVGSLVLTFGIGATLTGSVFIMTENT
jgi:hypothetical protein